MPSYDFKQLSPNDFEELSRDLIQARDQITLESFKSGKDGGIDFRIAHGSRNTIVQCKHYSGTGFAGLLNSLVKESTKAQKLNPTRYILITSVGLSPDNKTSIAQMFGQFLCTADIIGQDDLNNLLTLHPSVQMTHYKLWLASKVVLDRVIHNASITQSEFDTDRVRRDIQRYVSSAAFPRALKMLDSERVAIISGAPGVGKTSLAKMLLYYYLDQGYEVVSIVDGFRRGRERYHKGSKQIFYYDDFIGATFLGESGSSFTRNEDREILDFIELVRGSPSTALILTTREHILRQALTISEKLKHSTLIDSHCILEIADYSERQRALILYNHIYFSDLPKEYIKALLKDRFYATIIKHAKFNPRLIEWLSSYRRLKSILPEQYREFVSNLLENPAEIWSHAYENQISDAARSVLLALYLCGGRTNLPGLEETYISLHSIRSRRYGFRTQPSDWRKAILELNGSFVRPTPKFEFINPSVIDMLNEVIRLDESNLIDLVDASCNFPQIRRLWLFVQAEGNNRLFDYFVREPVRLANALTRLLKTSTAIQKDVEITYYHSNTLESRANTVLQIANAVYTPEIQEVAIEALEAMKITWETSQPDIIAGTEVFQELHNNKNIPSKVKDFYLNWMIDTMLTHIQDESRSNELCAISTIIDAIPCSTRSEQLAKGVEHFLDDNFGSELSEQGSVSECEAFETDIITLGELISVDVSSECRRIAEKIGELEVYEDEQSAHAYETWKETRSSHSDATPSIDELFNTLA
ncbi:restriction endonuclease [Enterobacterales bacterium BD_CKDN230030183-1A_HGKHYDSX7]